MAGPTSLKSVKALLTRYCNNLERIVKENEAVIKADPETFCDSAKSAKAQAVTLQLNSSVNLVIEALNAFTTMCDSLGDTLTAEQQEQVDDYVTKAHNVLELAQTAAIQLECNRTSARDHAQMRPSESAWVMQNALADLDEIISMEERISEMVHSKPDGNPPPFFRENKRPKLTSIGSGHCIFCGSGDHKSMFCKKCITLEERRTVFREHNRCLNCAITGHFIKDCPKGAMGKKHHHTLCPTRCQKSTPGAP
ncbi:zinc knuckle, partial [Ostertagia ostertagi]